ncbi:MAG: hypothetical protein M3297_11855, partial [Thermoproteota archaeon]|nr:hypothetical protein [Thermoproteota archaeon]
TSILYYYIRIMHGIFSTGYEKNTDQETKFILSIQIDRLDITFNTHCILILVTTIWEQLDTSYP